MNLKYNRTPHLPWSPGMSNDDKMIKNISSLLNVPVTITLKMDGGNACLQTSGVFARTHASIPTHPSFDHLKAFYSIIKHKLVNNFQYFGENMYAKHSIEYSELPGYFLLFNIRDLESQTWLSWNEVKMWAEELEIPTVPVLFEGILSSEEKLKNLINHLMSGPPLLGGEKEGVVIRVSNEFKDVDFGRCMAKWVRKSHVTTNDHWSHQEMVKNRLK